MGSQGIRSKARYFAQTRKATKDMNAIEWKREHISGLRTRIRIEEAILQSLRAELEELQWLNKQASELRYGWDVALSIEDQERRAAEEQFELIWMIGQHGLKSKSPDVSAEAMPIDKSAAEIGTVQFL